jgi:hypothetical protein
MKKIHLLSTEKYSDLVHSTSKYGGLFLSRYYSPMKEMGDSYQHIYITSDEEIKVADWVLAASSSTVTKCEMTPLGLPWKKIILTTDPDLIADGVQAIDDDFLEWFVKNPSCEKVEVEHFGTCCGNQSITQCINCKKYNPVYRIIIPQEKPKQDPTLENAKLALREYLLTNKEKVTKDLQEMREKSGTSKDETLEEAAERTYQKGLQDDIDLSFYDGVRLGAKYQSERMYSEEELKNAIEISVAKALGVMSFTINEESFEQFKKKQHIK